jgi:transmembrane sensor
MADVQRLPGIRQVEQEACRWIARLAADDVNDEDLVRFDAWKQAHPLNSKVHQELSQVWLRLIEAGPRVPPVPHAESQRLRHVHRRSRCWRLALASAAIVATLLGGLHLQWSTPAIAYRTAVGEHITVTLVDGSVLELNSNSMVRVDYSQHQRIVYLDRGEAFFMVAPSPSRPFSVLTPGGAIVRAIGTEFDVYLKAAGPRVTVRAGTVSAGENHGLFASARPADLQPWVILTGGQQADFEAGSARKRALLPTEVDEAVAWRSGTVYFENRPLPEVVAELNRYSIQQLVIADDALRALRVGGLFQADPRGAAGLLHILEHNLKVQVRREGTYTYLRSPPESPGR